MRYLEEITHLWRTTAQTAIIRHTEYTHTYHDVTTEYAESSLAYVVLLQHAAVSALLCPDVAVPSRSCLVRSTLSDLECVITMPCEPGAASGSVLRRRTTGMWLCSYLSDGVFEQCLEGQPVAAPDALVRLLGQRVARRNLDQDPVLLADLRELCMGSVAIAT